MKDQKTLEDLVPPMELCKQAAEVIGDETALVWMDEFDEDDFKLFVRGNLSPGELEEYENYPAPTLAELLEMLPSDVHKTENLLAALKCQKTRDGRYWLTYKTSIKDHANLPDAEFDSNPATAALRLLLAVKGSVR